MTKKDKENIEYIIWSINLIYEWLGKKNFTAYENDVKTTDAICTRLYYIGKAYGLLSKETRELLSKTDAFILKVFIMEHFYDDETLWDILKGSDDFGPLKNCIDDLESILNKKTSQKIGSSKMSIEFKHSIRTSKSVWTVRKK